MPEMSAALVSREQEDDTKGQYAFHGPRDNPQRKLMGKVFIPRLDVEGEQRPEQREDGIPALTEVHGGGEQEDFQHGVTGVDAMVEELPEGSALARAPRLGAVDCVEGLV